MAKAPKMSASKPVGDTGSTPSPEVPANASAPSAPNSSPAPSVATARNREPPVQTSDASVLDIVREAFPRTAALVASWRATNDGLPTALRITSKVDGFRRAGIAHSKSPVDWPLMGQDGEEVFQPAEIEQLLSEPNLTVELV